MAIALSVNVNKIALLRNSREGNYPCVVEHAKRCLAAGAHGITVHPRPDQRHIRPGDCQALAELIRPMSQVEFNIEGNPLEGPLGDYPGFLTIIEQNRPDQATLVPDNSGQLTSDHGFDLRQCAEQIEPIITQIKSQGVRVSLFMDPDPEQIQLAKQVGADRIELYTGPFAQAYARDNGLRLFEQHVKAANCALELGLGINAGHDLNLQNMQLFKHLPGLLEVSIGHALTVESMEFGLAETLKRYLALCA